MNRVPPLNPRVKFVRALADYRLRLVFTNGESGIFDCRPLLDFGVFRELRDVDYFRRVRAVQGSVAWPREQDICPDTLYLDSRKTRPAAATSRPRRRPAAARRS